MDLKLTGKTAIVTGASKGIGLATVLTLVAEGVRVAAASRTSSPRLERAGVVAVSVDLSTAEGAIRLVERAVGAVGEIDILVNNVGGAADSSPATGGFLSYTDQQWQDVIDLNLFSAVRVTRAALPSLLRMRGSIVNISSDSARRPATAPLPYGAAKGALNVFSKGLAEEFGPQGVRVNTVSPSSTRTNMWEGEGSFGAQVAASLGLNQQQLIAALPTQAGMITGRFIEPDEIASIVAYLASPLAASVIGANYVVDAGVSKTL